MLSVLANDTGDGLKITNVSRPQHGTTSFTDRTISYKPQSGFTGTDGFTYTVSDGTNTSTGSVTLDVVQGVHMFLPMVAR